MTRHYSNIAVATTLSAGIGVGDASCAVVSATGYPAAPFAIVVDGGTVNEEVMLVTVVVGLTFTITRGYDGTTAAIHSAGAAVIHAAIADDLRGTQLGTRDMATTAPNASDVVTWSGTTWAPAALPSSAPSGPAGGVLSGTYPNPGFAADMATQAELDAETSARSGADTTLQSNITSEASTRSAADLLRLLIASNLSDLNNVVTARTNLGLGGLAVLSSITASLILDASANGRSLITATDYAAMRTLLALVIGANVQAWDADLDAIALLATTAFGRSYLALADAAAGRALAGSAPADAKYITQTANSELSAEQALSSLASGYLKNTTATGVLSVQATPIPSADLGTGGGGTGAKVLADNQTWITPFDPSTTMQYYDDFLGLITLINTSSGAGSGSVGSNTAADTGGHPGLLEQATGTTTTGRTAATSTGLANIAFGSGAIVYETDIYINDGLSDGTDTYQLWRGFNDSVTGTGTDMIAFRYTNAVNGGKFECVTRSNSVETATDSGVTVANQTWTKLRIEINAAGTSVAFYINGSLVTTNTTNIPTGAARVAALMHLLIKSAGTNNRRVFDDYIFVRMTMTTPR